MEKLVRDRIPDIIRATGVEPLIRIAAAAELSDLLRAKLVEEVIEYLDSADPGELADIFEVLLALARDHGLGPGELEQLRADKEQRRGGFTQGIVWSSSP